MKAKDILLQTIYREGIKHLFCVPGGLVDPFLTAFGDCPDIQPIVAAQEGGAAYMADGYARASKKFGVCLGIGGPGILNMTTAAVTSKSDASPILMISGEVATTTEGLGGFQDASLTGLDDFNILQPAVNYSVTVESPNLFLHHFQKALTHMLGIYKGPVHLCLPRDVQEADIAEELPKLNSDFDHVKLIDQEMVDQALSAIAGPRLAILIGEGCDQPETIEHLKHVAQTYCIPVATTLKAKGVFAEDDSLSLGVFGYAGTQHATQALLQSDLDTLIVIGSSLNQRDSMCWTEQLQPTQQLIQVNTNPLAFSYLYPRSLKVLCDSLSFLQQLLEQKTLAKDIDTRKNWVETIRKSPRLYDEQNLNSSSTPIHPARVVRELRQAAPKNTTLVIDSGAHRAFFGHYWTSYEAGQYISATNLGPMGWAIPAGIGVKLANPDQPCCVITGDGCMLMHGMEIHTAARYNVPVIFVVINNGALGNVYLRAKTEGRVPIELTSYPTINLQAFAQSLGLTAFLVEDPKNLAETFKKAFALNAPVLIDIRCGKDFTTPVYPFNQARKEWQWNYHD